MYRTYDNVAIPGMIEATIKGLKDNKSPGADGISPRLLKEIVDDIIYSVLCTTSNIYAGSGQMQVVYLSSKRAVDVSIRHPSWIPQENRVCLEWIRVFTIGPTAS